MRESRSRSVETSPVLPSHRVPAHLARRFHQICLGVTAEILVHEDLTPLDWGVMAAVLEQPGTPSACAVGCALHCLPRKSAC